MKYLVIQDKHVDVETALQIVRGHHARTKEPHFKKRQPQFFFPNNELTKEQVEDIAKELGMQEIKITRDRAVIGCF